MIPLGKVKYGIISRVATIFDKPWALLSVVVLSFVVNAFIYPDGFWGTHTWSGWNIVNNLLFFILGYLFQANEHIIDNIKKIGWITLFLGIATIVYLFTFVDELSNPSDYYGTSRYILSQFVQSVNAWCWLFAILSLASRFLTGTNRFLRYANEAVLPFYILHQTVIVVIGFYVVQLNMGVGPKYLVIASTSFVAIMALYEIIRRFNVFRFLFGMRPKQKSPVAPELSKFTS